MDGLRQGRTWQWITSEEARALENLATQVDGICVGVETVLSDNPKLTSRIREFESGSYCCKFATSNAGRSHCCKDCDADENHYRDNSPIEKSSHERLAELGVEITGAARGKVDLAQALAKLHELGIQTHMAEAEQLFMVVSSTLN